MPQMAPLMWTTLFSFFTILYLITAVKMYYSSHQSINSTYSNKNEENQELNWKW